MSVTAFSNSTGSTKESKILLTRFGLPQPQPSRGMLVLISIHETLFITASCKYSTQTKFYRQPFRSLSSILLSTFTKGWRRAVENTTMQSQGH